MNPKLTQADAEDFFDKMSTRSMKSDAKAHPVGVGYDSSQHYRPIGTSFAGVSGVRDSF